MYLYKNYFCLSIGVLKTGTPFAGGRGSLPLTISAAFSANIIVGAFRLPKIKSAFDYWKVGRNLTERF